MANPFRYGIEIPPLAMPSDLWPPCLAMLRNAGGFDGGSAIGDGMVMRRDGTGLSITADLSGYLRIQAAGLAVAQALVAGNPVFEIGGSVEIRELQRD